MKKIDITPQELCERLFKGESFYNKTGSRLFTSNSRFKYETTEGDVWDADINNWFSDIYTKPHWTDNLSEEKPVLCWVGLPAGFQVALIKGTDSGLYVCRSNNKWANAEPVKLSEACIWEEGNVN